MTREALVEAVENFVPYNEQEENDRKLILEYLSEPDIFERTNETAHITASAWVVNKTRDKVLMCFHKIYNSWSWFGGHADGDMDLLNVAIREVQEESGLKTVTPVLPDIFSLEVLTVDGHVKKGKYVSSHLHVNISYLLEGDENETLEICRDENSGVAWFFLDEAVDKSTEPWFQEHIYRKLNEKLHLINKG